MASGQRSAVSFKEGSGVEEIVVIGGGGHAKVVIGILRKISSYQLLGYTDLKDRGMVLGAIYLGPDEKLSVQSDTKDELSAVLAIGQVGLGNLRFEVWDRLKSPRLSFPTIVSPDAIVNDQVSCAEGVVVMDGAVINPGAKIGLGAIINTNCTIEHDVELADWVHVAPGATISGGVKVGRFSMIGAGATVIEGRKIADGCVVGAGATVVNDLEEPGVYVGCPARRIK
jgi:sugar O-acyltransferase (sialic acid O-acetyltransferase NeuD family)